MPGSILGTEVVRVEDPDLLLGRATYLDNLPVAGLLHLAFVRSSIAHGLITSIDTSAAATRPGVVAVLSAADLGAPRFKAFGAVMNEAHVRPPLADGKVRFVGEPVVVIAAATKTQALDAAEYVVVEYERLESVTDMEAALADGAPLQFEEVGSNLAAGMQDPPADVLSDAEVVIRGRFENQRIAVVPMEGNALTVIPGPAKTTVYVSTQMPHAFKMLASGLFGYGPDELHVITPHVGGGFGGKAGICAEHVASIAVARKLNRPVRWVETRSENMVSLPHGRGQVQYIEMGFKRDGTITGLKARVVGDAGAYGGFGGGLAMGPTRNMAQGVYKIPKISYDVAVAVTNTTPMGAFRGAGRPEAAAMLERIMDMAADELKIDPIQLRRKNLLTSDQFPYQTLMGPQYDVGDYDAPLREVERIADYPALLAEQKARRDRGDRVQMGVGVSAYVEVTAGGMSTEYAAVEIHDDGKATVKAGTSAHGQGHATSFAMIVSDRLGIPVSDINLVQSDTELIPRGSGTGGSRSLQIGGSAVHGAATAVLDRGKKLAAQLLEADESDIVVHDGGRIGVAGVPSRTFSWSELAIAAKKDDGDPLAEIFDFNQANATFPFGSHLAVVEVDMETGEVRLVRHIAVDDCGRMLNPMLVRGQQHGGIAQGAAQVLWEQFVYDEEGNPLTSTQIGRAHV